MCASHGFSGRSWLPSPAFLTPPVTHSADQYSPPCAPELCWRSLRPSPRDRKSTRLNSSHGSISYAVFCLKKNKKKEPARRMLEKIKPVSTDTKQRKLT